MLNILQALRLSSLDSFLVHRKLAAHLVPRRHLQLGMPVGKACVKTAKVLLIGVQRMHACKVVSELADKLLLGCRADLQRLHSPGHQQTKVGKVISKGMPALRITQCVKQSLRFLYAALCSIALAPIAGGLNDINAAGHNQPIQPHN